MEREKIMAKLHEMLAIAEQVNAEVGEIGLVGDMDRITAILKEKIRLLDPLNFDSVNYFDLKGIKRSGSNYSRTRG